MVRWLTNFLLSAALTSSTSSGAADPSRQHLDPNEGVFQDAKKPHDSRSLIEYVQKLAANDEDLQNLPGLIRRLGSEKPKDRQDALKRISRLGRAAAKDLRAATLDRDAELARLAAKCLAEMPDEIISAELPAAAIRLLAKRNLPECVELLLRYLPYASDLDIEEEIYCLIDRLCISDKRINPKLIAALNDSMAARRAVAGCIVARVGNGDNLEQAGKLLQDPVAYVRLRTAQGFLAAGSSRGLGALIDLLDAKPIEIALQAEELLSWAAGDESPATLPYFKRGFADGPDKAAWLSWFERKGKHFDLTKITRWSSRPALVQIVATRGSDLTVIGHDGRERWKVPQPESALRIATLGTDNSIVGARVLGSDKRGQLSWQLVETSIDGHTILATRVALDLMRGSFAQDLRGNIIMANGNTIQSFHRQNETVQTVRLSSSGKHDDPNLVLQVLGFDRGTAIVVRSQRGGIHCLGIDFRSGNDYSELWSWKPDGNAFSTVRQISRGKVAASDGRFWYAISRKGIDKLLPADFQLLDAGLDSSFLVDDDRCHRLLWIDANQRIIGEIPFSRSIKTSHRAHPVWSLCSFGFGDQPLHRPLQPAHSLDRVALLNSSNPGRQLIAVGQLRQRGHDVFVEVTPKLLGIFSSELHETRASARNVTLTREIEQLFFDNAAVSFPALRRSLFSPNDLKHAATLYLIRMLSAQKQLEIDEEMAERIIALASDANAIVRKFALFALAGCAKAIDPDRRARVIAKALNDRSGELNESPVALMAASSLASLDGSDFERIRPELTKALNGQDENVTRFVLHGITVQIEKKNASALSFYESVLKLARHHPESIVQSVAVSCLGRVPALYERAIPVLISLIDGHDKTPDDVRLSAITALRDLQTRSKSAIPCLLSRLHFPEESIDQAASFSRRFASCFNFRLWPGPCRAA